MTGPLIDRDVLADVLVNAAGSPDWEQEARDQADAVMTYLRSVLTPEALDPTETVPHGEYVMKRRASGDDLHRRILGGRDDG